MNKWGKSIITGLLAAFLTIVPTLLVPSPAQSSAAQITGTVIGPDGTPLSGRATLTLAYPCIDTVTNQLVQPAPVSYQLVNGQFPSNAYVERNDQCSPGGTYYVVKYYSQSGSMVAQLNYYINATSFNIGQAIPTSLTTSQLSFQNPALLNVPQTWTATQTFAGLQWTSGGPFLGSLLQTNTANRSYTFPDANGTVCLNGNCNASTVDGVTITGTPSVGQVPTATGPTTATWQGAATGGLKVECANATPVTVTNTVAATAMMSCTVPANELTGSQDLTIYGQGNILQNNGVNTSYTLQVFLDGASLYSDAITTSTSGTLVGWNTNGHCILVSGGAGGTIECEGNFLGTLITSSFLSAGNSTLSNGQSGQPIAFNTTVSHVLDVVITMSVAAATNVVQQRQFLITRIG